MSQPTQQSGAAPNMHDRVIAEMRRRIISGELAAGVNLSEIALAESFGVSRTPVREALKRLQSEGLVTIRPRVGTFVTTPSRREITELFEMKELLEGAAARLLAQRGRVPEVDRLEQNLVEADMAVDDVRQRPLRRARAGVPRPADHRSRQRQARGALPDADEPARLPAAGHHIPRASRVVRLQSDEEHHRVLKPDRREGRRQCRAGDARARARQPDGADGGSGRGRHTAGRGA